MPRFFFNVRDGRNIPDNTGEEFPDWHGAREYAVKYAGKILNDESSRLAVGEDWCMEVTDQQGLVMFRLDFFVSLAPVVAGKS